jgi:hypothetical protein
VQHQLLAKIVEALDAAGIEHMVTGSFASTFHGEPRMTRAIDVVIDPDTASVALFVAEDTILSKLEWSNRSGSEHNCAALSLSSMSSGQRSTSTTSTTG